MADRVTLGAITVDLWTGKTSSGAVLRPLELRVLRLLAAHAGEVVSAEQILVDAFDYAPGTKSKTLYTTMYRLRGVLEPVPTRPRYLLAERGGGYKLALDEGGPPPVDTNIQPALDAFVDRRERTELDDLAEAGAPLVVLVGPGGSGKSRVALEHASRRRESAWLLAIHAGSAPLASAVAEALREPPAASVDAAVERLARLARESPLGTGRSDPCLLVIDDAEQALDEVRAAVVALRRSAPTARLLVTSREPLHVPGEHRLEVGPLPEDAAVELLIARAGGAAGALPPEQGRTIVGALDRLPLAIELAADRLAAVGPAELVSQLARNSPLAGPTGERSLRHRSLDAVLDDTWARLQPWEREALERLSVLAGAFSLSVAEAALSGAWVHPADGLDAAGIVAALHERGLLSANRAGVGRPYVHLRTVRDRVRERARPEIRALALDGVAAYTVALARVAYPDGESPVAAPFDGGQDEDGVEAALRHARDPSGLAELALVALAYRTGRFAVCEAWARPALDRAPTLERRGQLLDLLSTARYHLGRGAEAAETWRAILDDARLPAPLRFTAGHRLASWLGGQGRWDERGGVRAALAALIPPDPVGADALRLAHLAGLSGEDAARAGDEAAAVEWFERSRAAYRTAGDPTGATLAWARIGASLARRNRVTEALATLRRAADALPADAGRLPRDAVVVAYLYGLLAEQAVRSHAPDGVALAARALEAARSCASDTQRMLLAVRAEAEILSGRLDDAGRTIAAALAEGGPEPDVYLNAVHRAAAHLELAHGRFAAAADLAAHAAAEAAQLDVVPWAATEVLVEALVAQRRIAPARDALLRVVDAARPGAAAPIGALLQLAELARWVGEPGEARWVTGIAAAAPGTTRERARALATAAAWAAQVGAPEADRLLDEAHGAAEGAGDLDGTLAAWLAVQAARVALARGAPIPPIPAAPVGAAVLRRAIAECLGGSA